jgi:phage shock protein A
MALLERVARLLRANLNELIDRSEDPEKALKQVILDMQNQLMQVKTQVAIAIADQHLLTGKQKEHESSAEEYLRKAETAVQKKKDDLARSAIERSLSYRQMAANFRQQYEDQKVQVEMLKSALKKLEQRLKEVEQRSVLLVSRQRKARALARAAEGRASLDSGKTSSALERLKNKAMLEEATGHAKAELYADDVAERFAALDRDEEIDRLLRDIKQRQFTAPPTKD